MAQLVVDGEAVSGERVVLGRPGLQPPCLRWSRPDEAPRDVRFSGHSIAVTGRGEQPLPGLGGELVWTDVSGTHRRRISVSEHARPEATRLSCLADFARRLDALVGREGLKFEELGRVPLFFHEGLWKTLDSTPLDDLIERTLPALRRIGGQARARLREEHATLPVERVRRPARDAERDLSRTGRFALAGGGVARPSHLKARLITDDFGTYENRALLTLVHRLRARAACLLQKARFAMEQIESLEIDLQRAAHAGLRKRVGAWRKLAGLDSGDRTIERLIEKGRVRYRALETQMRVFAAITEGPLGRQLREFLPVQGALADTNLFAYDDDHAAVAVLWRAAAAEAGDPPLDLRYDDPDRTYSDFCRIVVAHAFARLGFKGDGHVPLSGRTARDLKLVRSDGWEAVLTGHERDTIVTLRRADPHADEVDKRLGRQPRPPETLRFGPTFEGTCERPPSAGVWLHPHTDLEGRDGPEYARRASTGFAPVSLHGAVPPPALPLAPWHFASVEVMIRFLRTRTLAVDLAAGRVPQECPVCGSGNTALARADDRVCHACESRWGVRDCECGGRIPKLLPKLPTNLGNLAADFGDGFASRQHLLDLLVGPDGLAELCQADEALGGLWMICPRCGGCGRDEPKRKGCPRCAGGPQPR